MLGKTILSIFLLISAILVSYYPIKVYQSLGDARLEHDLKTELSYQIAGFSLLFFVIFIIIWYIPAPEQEEQEEEKGDKQLTEEQQEALKGYGKAMNEEHLDEEEETSTDRNVNEMIEKGYVFNVETGKWEKPNPNKKA